MKLKTQTREVGKVTKCRWGCLVESGMPRGAPKEITRALRFLRSFLQLRLNLGA